MSILAGLGGGGGGTAHSPEVKQGSRLTPYLLLAPGMLWLFIFFAVPMVFLASQSIQTGSLTQGYALTWNFSIYPEVISQYFDQFARSFIFAFVATFAAVLIGYPVAYTIAFKAGKYKNLLLVLVVAPFFTSFLIRTLAWQTILTTDGPVTNFLRSIGVLSVFEYLHIINTDQILNTPLSVITGLTYNFLPFMILPLYASLERLDPKLLEAGGDLYAKPWTAFRKVTFPLSLPGLVAGTLLTFIPAAGDYINSTLLGNTQTSMIGQVIERQFLQVLDYPTAAALSFTLMISIVVLVAIYIWRSGTEDLL